MSSLSFPLSPLLLSLHIQETEAKWLSYSSDKPVALMKEVFPMTIKGICRSCFCDVFESGDELDRLSESYHKCWSEMEVIIMDNGAVDMCYKIKTIFPTSVYICMHWNV